MYRRLIYILSFLFASASASFAKDFPIDNEFPIKDRINCAAKASIKYNVPVDALLAISSIENGNIDTVSRNSNGSYDYGVMQVNEIYIYDLNKKHGLNLTKEDFLKKDCFSFEVAAFKVKEHIKFDQGDLLTKIAMYHSRTPRLNKIYKKKLINHARYWSDFLLKNNFKLYIYSQFY